MGFHLQKLSLFFLSLVSGACSLKQASPLPQDCVSPSAVPVSVRAGPCAVSGRTRQAAPGHSGWGIGQSCRQRAAGTREA